MARAWLINSRGIAGKVKNAAQVSTPQIKDWIAEAYRQCPNCSHRIDNSDVSIEWPGFPAGVGFDPSDLELLEHLAGKMGVRNSRPHLFLDEFIPTLEEEGGICYTHPENLPGIKKDGSSVHFFHRTANAYATGHRKRRKIQDQHSFPDHVRWHKTGITRPIIENGVQKGCKKIMVLYKGSKKGSKPDKSNWVMHQYHLGTEEDEKEGEFVVSKVFYQQQQKQLTEKSYADPHDDETDTLTARASPRTPKTKTPDPPRPAERSPYDEADEEQEHLSVQDVGCSSAILQPDHSAVPLDDENVNPTWWPGESQADEEPSPNDIDDLLFGREILDSNPVVGESERKNVSCFSDFSHNQCNPLERNFNPISALSEFPNVIDDLLFCRETLDPNPVVGESELKNVSCFSDFGHNQCNPLERNFNLISGLSEFPHLEVDPAPDFDLADLQFGSQESITGWIDRLKSD